MTQFEQPPDEKFRPINERRSGIKKVDDEHLINIAKQSEFEAKKRKEREIRMQRSFFIQSQIQKLTEDGN